SSLRALVNSVIAGSYIERFIMSKPRSTYAPAVSRGLPACDCNSAADGVSLDFLMYRPFLYISRRPASAAWASLAEISRTSERDEDSAVNTEFEMCALRLYSQPPSVLSTSMPDTVKLEAPAGSFTLTRFTSYSGNDTE